MKRKLPFNLGKLYYFLVGYKTRRDYWTCSKFAAWIRKKSGVTPKVSGTAEQWDDWHKENKGKTGYWLAEEGLDILQDIWMFIPDVYNRVRIYIRNRFIDHTHHLTSHLKKGEYYDMDTLMIHTMFDSLVDFVEIEKAWMQQISEQVKGKRKRRGKTPNAKDGLNYLAWEMTVDVPNQKEAAKEILSLYWWWKHIRPNRPDPMDASGLSSFYDRKRQRLGTDSIFAALRSETDDEKAEWEELHKECVRLEIEQDEEDTQMMFRLVKLRKNLWT